MSFFPIDPAPARLNRSELAVPGSQPNMFEKAAQSDADVVFLDLEDAVAPDEKPQARKNIIKALNELDWGKKTMSLRINGLDTHYMYRDVVDVVEQAGGRLDMIMIPKVGTAADVYAVDMLVTQIEDAKGYKKRIGFEHIIETALGMQNVTEIAKASKRNESLHFGVADYAASTRARTTIIGGVNPDYSVLTDRLEDGSRAVGFCNFGIDRADISYKDFEKLGLNGQFVVRDLWRQKDLSNLATKSGELKLNVPAHGVVLYKFTPVK